MFDVECVDHDDALERVRTVHLVLVRPQALLSLLDPPSIESAQDSFMLRVHVSKAMDLFEAGDIILFNTDRYELDSVRRIFVAIQLHTRCWVMCVSSSPDP
jgi:hypothetical protein